jgi:hypothetical protein
MPINHEPEPQPFHIVLHFRENPFYFSTYVLALIPKYAIELAHAKLYEHAEMLDIENIKPDYASVNDGKCEQYFVNRSGEWLELEAWRSMQAAKKARNGRPASLSLPSQNAT